MLRQGFAGQAGLNTTTVGASGRGGRRKQDLIGGASPTLIWKIENQKGKVKAKQLLLKSMIIAWKCG
jgi:hypothetical protein